jgi:D-alanyl-D-alanine carboxypeptidase/D-alanyl-D-alanine-endopeptidase (penicillin-binding protein 4)
MERMPHRTRLFTSSIPVFAVPALACLLIAASTGLGQSESRQQALSGALNSHGVRGVTLGAMVVDLSNGQTLFEQNAGMPLIPASNAKLVVIAAAFERLGGDFKFETVFGLRGDDLVVIGGGDPAFGDPRLAKARDQTTTAAFHRLADALTRRGVTEIRGRLLFDDSIFDGQWTHPNWPANQHQAWYEAPIGGLNLANNCVEVWVEPAAAGTPPVVRMSPGNTALTVRNTAKSGGKHRAIIDRRPGSPEIRLTGAVSKSAIVGEVTVVDPGLFFAASLRTSLAARGIRIVGDMQRARLRNVDGTIPADIQRLTAEQSPLVDIASRAGRNSQGMMAEGLIKMLGVRDAGVGSWASGAAAVSEFVRKLGVSPEECRFDDGSGLSRENRLSARATVRVLQHMQASRNASAFAACLSRSGIDGTLDDRLRDLRGRVIGKTGYINGVRTLAGYATTDSGRKLAFAFFYNDVRGSTGPLTRAQDAACRILCAWTSEASTTPTPTRDAGGGDAHGAARRR